MIYKSFLPLALIGVLYAAATPTAKAAPATISFNVAARVETGSGNSRRAQSMKSRVHIKGSKARVETQIVGQQMVVLALSPYVYRLLPSSKSGVRYKGNNPVPEFEVFSKNWVQLLASPSKIPALLAKKGARNVGKAKYNGTLTTVYAASRWEGQSRSVKIWLRGDNLPVHLESSESGIKVFVTWSGYKRGHALADGLFRVPGNYKIRDGKPPRSF